MPHPKTLNCRNCGTPVALPEQKPGILFPEDYEGVISFMQARWSAVECPLCGVQTGLAIPLVVVDNARRAALLCAPEGGEYEEALKKAAEDFDVKSYRSYPELHAALLAWVNDHAVERSKALFSGEYEKLARAAQVELFTPLFLRLFQEQAEGRLSATDESGGAADKRVVASLGKMYALLLREHLRRIMLEACRTRTLLELPAEIEARVPARCLTAEVLEAVAGGCPPHPRPEEGPAAFAKSFPEEYLNAVAHAHAGAPNPRGIVWATYMRNVWHLSRMENVVIDPQMLLTPEIARKIGRVEDLWDVSMPHVFKRGQTGEDVAEAVEDTGRMMEHYGFAEEYADALKSRPLRVERINVDDAQLGKKLREAFKAQFLESYKFKESPERSEELGRMVGAMTAMLLADASEDDALNFVREMLEDAAASDDKIAVVSISSNAVEQLNKFELYEEARKIISSALGAARDRKLGAPPSLLIHFWNELGNVMRYMHQNEGALKAYELVGKLIDMSPDEESARNNRATLRRNLAIVYRQMGRFSKSIKILLDDAAARPEDDALQHTLSVLYLAINRYAEALKYVDKALSSRAARLDERLAASYLVTRATIKLGLGDAEGGAADLMRAFAPLTREDSPLKRRIASAAMDFYPASEEGRRFVEECKALISGALAGDDSEFDPSRHLTLLFQFCSRLVREGDSLAAKELIEREWPYDDGDVETPWEFDHLRGLISYGLGEYEEAWAHMRAALAKLERDVPVAEDVPFAPFWMQNKDVFQTNLASVCLDLVERGTLDTAELLAVYEFMNGKEISARLEKRGSAEAVARPMRERLAESAAAAGGVVAKAFAFVEAGEKIRVLCVPLGGGEAAFVEDLTLNTREVAEVRRRTQAALKAANPSDLSLLDRQLVPWRALGARLGESLAPHLSGCERACFLPGRAFTGLPLQLMELPGGVMLLERMPVIYAPNFSTLLAAPSREGAGGGACVVTVTKRGERPDFEERAYEVSERLLALMRGGGEARGLKGEASDHRAVKEALARSSEVVFICHGTTAGPEKGYGICVADGGDLPPSLLPVSEFPDLDRFILTWQDIDDLARSPELFVSVACSTGITEVAGGGVRFGLEQSLFGTGTRHIVSPLWDVEQAPALRWLEHFFGARAANPGWALDRAFRHASLSLAEEFQHPYFWGAFILNGSAMLEAT